MRALRPLWLATAGVTLLGLIAELGDYLLGASQTLVEFFSLSYEKNLPTWYASSLLLGASLLLLRGSDSAGAQRWRWKTLAGIFVFMSLDEAVELHEHLGALMGGTHHGLTYFSWVIPGAAIVLVLGLAMLPMIRALPPRTRRCVVTSAILYVGGALGMELPLGVWTENHGDDNLVYGLIDWTEECLELVGLSLFLSTLLLHLESVDRRPSSPPAPTLEEA